MTPVPLAVKLCRQPQLERLAVVGELDHAGVAELETAFAGLSTVLGGSNRVIDVSASNSATARDGTRSNAAAPPAPR